MAYCRLYQGHVKDLGQRISPGVQGGCGKSAGISLLWTDGLKGQNIVSAFTIFFTIFFFGY